MKSGWFVHLKIKTIIHKGLSYMLDSLVVTDSFVLSTRINVDELFIMRVLLKVATLSITHEADKRASASWSQHSSMVSHIDRRPLETKWVENDLILFQLKIQLWENKEGEKEIREILVFRAINSKILLTGCFRHVSCINGRSFLCTTLSCMSSNVG